MTPFLSSEQKLVFVKMVDRFEVLGEKLGGGDRGWFYPEAFISRVLSVYGK